jgi:hypothetical protein
MNLLTLFSDVRSLGCSSTTYKVCFSDARTSNPANFVLLIFHLDNSNLYQNSAIPFSL